MHLSPPRAVAAGGGAPRAWQPSWPFSSSTALAGQGSAEPQSPRVGEGVGWGPVPRLCGHGHKDDSFLLASIFSPVQYPKLPADAHLCVTVMCVCGMLSV